MGREWVTFSKWNSVRSSDISNIHPPPPKKKPLTLVSPSDTNSRPSWRDRFKCHAALPHNTRLTELILPCQEQRPHIVHTLNCRIQAEALTSISSKYTSGAISQSWDVSQEYTKTNLSLLVKENKEKKAHGKKKKFTYCEHSQHSGSSSCVELPCLSSSTQQLTKNSSTVTTQQCHNITKLPFLQPSDWK